MRIIFFSLLLLISFMLPMTAYAIPDDGNAGGGASGPCDFGQFLDKLGERESGNRYGIKNSLGYLGRWQFGKGALSDIGWYKNGQWLGKMGVNSDQDFLNSPAAQDQAMKEWMDRMASEIKTFGLTKYINRTVGGCQVTWSGLLAGRHLCGIGKSSGGGGKCSRGTSLKQYLESNGTVVGVDGNNTPVSEYVCKFGGLNTPYDHNALATSCSTVNNAGETGGTGTPITYPGTPGSAHDGPNVETPPTARFEYLALSLKYIWVAAFQQMTSQLTTFMMQQVEIIGTFFDAKHQLETQRLMQEKAAKAHKDYHPSEQMCEIGTFVRNLTNSQRRSDLTKSTLSQSMMDRALATGDSKTSDSDYDDATKTRALIDKFCSKADNAGQNEALCEGVIHKPEQINADINFTQSIDAPLTLDVNLLDDEIKPDEENIFAFLDYIFMHEKFPWMSQDKTTLFSFVQPYQDMRSVIAMRSVAQNSFAEIIAQKTSGPDGEGESAGPFIKALMREMGMEDADIEATIGENPSYYAQMEMLTKRIYQHPDFISNLYDKPANVKRIRAAMTAIKLMQDRDIHDALMRREMLMSILLELQLRQKQDDILNKSVKPAMGVYGTGERNPYGVGTYDSETGAGGF